MNNKKSFEKVILRSLPPNVIQSQKKITLSHPQNEDFGDYSSTIAMEIAKREKMNPSEIARVTAQGIQERNPELFEKVDAVGGFINFTLKKSVLIKEALKAVREKEKYGYTQTRRPKKVMVEFTDPNPFKELHIGHLFSNTVGEAIARLIETPGAEVKRANYQGDVGMHVAKSIWGLKKKLAKDKLTLSELEKKPLKERVYYLGQAYSLGANAYKEDETAAEEIRDYNYLCYLAGQEYQKEKEGWKPIVDYKQYLKGKTLPYNEIKPLYFKGRRWSLEYFETIYKRLGTKFDYYFFESLAGEFGKKIVDENIKNEVFKKSKEAIVFEGEKESLHTRVFVNALGLPTYEAKDLGLAIKKFEKYKYDTSIIVTGNEVNDYFKVVLSALSKIDKALRDRTIHLGHGMLRLPEGKMSSRTGKVITAEWLLEEVKTRLGELVAERHDGKVDTSKIEFEKIAVGAVKYAILRSDYKKDLVFDFGKSLAFEGNSGPYLQYTYARCRSILREAGHDAEMGLTDENFDFSADNACLEKEEIALLRKLYKFPEVLADAAENLAPQKMCTYLFGLAKKFSVFYDKCPVLRAETDEQKMSRLLLVAATAQVIRNGLYVLGIETLERM